MQKGVHAKFVDMSTSVREAAVELIGRFVLNKPELILQYYDMIIERILVSSLFSSLWRLYHKLNVAKCNLGEVKLQAMLPTFLLICASSLWGGHP